MIGLKKRVFFPYYLAKDIYWRFIPPNCRECFYLSICRGGFFSGRKCINGCIKLNLLRKQKQAEEREDYFNSLLEYAEKQERRNRD